LNKRRQFIDTWVIECLKQFLPLIFSEFHKPNYTLIAPEIVRDVDLASPVIERWIAKYEAALAVAESFMCGFEDDETQVGINNMLVEIRALLPPIFPETTKLLKQEIARSPTAHREAPNRLRQSREWICRRTPARRRNGGARPHHGPGPHAVETSLASSVAQDSGGRVIHVASYILHAEARGSQTGSTAV
jgi:hypothetical protein